MVWFKRTRTTAKKMTDFEGIKRQQFFLYNMIKMLFKIDKVKDPCKFEDLADRGITDKKLRENLATFTFLYRFFGIIGVIVLLYTISLFYRTYYLGAIVGAAASVMFLAHAFKYHFWSFQIRNKKLGCTLGEWFDGLISRNKK
ncbi:MAG: hypothetical protein EP298_04440 [Gammaproteobacteria bacterium]|nr:MAG: hypothetical protein EP298_04440 [Gammaproteobacteria bacterium]UTW41660.1 hypothetical protein KFE69_09090 [bacterium SCSIO 12844]